LAEWAVRLLADTRPGQIPRQIILAGRLVDRHSAQPIEGDAVALPASEAVV